MKKTYKIYLRDGTTLKIKADDFKVSWNATGFDEWSAPNADHWVVFHPSDLVAVERVK